MAGILMIISDILSVITIVLCFVLKVPQIVKLFKAGEAGGLSLNGLLFQISSYSVTMLYNYTNHHSLISYLEYPLLIIQEYTVIVLVLHYEKYKPIVALSILAIFLCVVFVFAFEIFSKVILAFLLPFTTPVSALSKIMQLIQILRTKDASSVSTLTWFLSCFTNVTRIYTVYLDSANINLILNFTISSILSGAVLLAAMYYQRKKVRVE